MDVYVMGVAVHPAADAIGDRRLEEMAYATARAALDDAGVTRRDIDHVTLAASDEIDARGISSMLLAAPSGAYLKDEMRVTDSGLTALLCVTMLLPQMQNANRINFLWVFTEGLFALAATLSAVWLCRLIAPGRVGAGRKRTARVATA